MAAVHGTCVQVSDLGVLLLGASGSGKSDLALRLIDHAGEPAALLVADDQVLIESVDGRLIARPPETTAGRLEIRSIGIVTVPHATCVDLRLAVRLDADGDGPRLPDFSSQVVAFHGISIPQMRLDPFTASAAAKIRAMVQAVEGGVVAGPAGKGQ